MIAWYNKENGEENCAMEEKIILHIINNMQATLNTTQIEQLKAAVYIALIPYDFSMKKQEIISSEESWKSDLQDFLSTKLFEGKSNGTIRQYKYELERLLSYINKSVGCISSGDILDYLQKYKMIRKISNQYLENKRLAYSSFFTWLHTHGKISINPMCNISRFKVEKRIRSPFTDEERELLLLATDHIRDKAMMEFMYSTCVRVSELVNTDISDIQFVEKDLIVYGKGAKERITYINSRTAIYLKLYLKSRTDSNPALFVGLNKPHRRLTVSSVETIIRNIGIKASIDNTHPHRFRRTGATNAANRGMPIEEVSTMLGHEKLETTKMYCTVKQQSIKFNHGKYLSA